MKLKKEIARGAFAEIESLELEKSMWDKNMFADSNPHNLIRIIPAKGSRIFMGAGQVRMFLPPYCIRVESIPLQVMNRYEGGFFMSVFAKEIVDEEWGNYFELTGLGYGALVALMCAALLGACFFAGRKEGNGKKFSTRQLVFSSMAMALAVVTSMLKVVDMPMGGSVTLFSMLFICLIGYWYGLRGGLMTAVAYGILQLIIDPYIISIPQMLTDYVFAFGALGLSGIFSGSKNGLVKGYAAGVLGRYFFSFLSGMVFFGSYASAYNMAAPVYSLVYNGAYLGLEALATIILVAVPPVGKGLAKMREMAVG